jgi:hypothetical protein
MIETMGVTNSSPGILTLMIVGRCRQFAIEFHNNVGSHARVDFRDANQPRTGRRGPNNDVMGAATLLN